MPRERKDAFAAVIARSEATKQSTLSLPPDGLLRFARNDGKAAAYWMPRFRGA
jgi:hypothetical protein